MEFNYLNKKGVEKEVEKETTNVFANDLKDPKDIKSRVNKILADIKKSGKKIDNRIKNLALKACAGSLVALMLLGNLTSCEIVWVGGVETVPPATVVDVNMIVEKLKQGQLGDLQFDDCSDYDAKMAEFLKEDRHTYAGLDVCPVDFWAEYFDRPREEVEKVTTGYSYAFTKDSILIQSQYFPDTYVDDKRVVYGLFEYVIGEKAVEDLLTLYHNPIVTKSAKLGGRADKKKFYEYRYALDKIIKNVTPTCYGINNKLDGWSTTGGYVREVNGEQHGQVYTFDAILKIEDDGSSTVYCPLSQFAVGETPNHEVKDEVYWFVVFKNAASYDADEHDKDVDGKKITNATWYFERYGFKDGEVLSIITEKIGGDTLTKETVKNAINERTK